MFKFFDLSDVKNFIWNIQMALRYRLHEGFKECKYITRMQTAKQISRLEGSNGYYSTKEEN